MYRKVATYLLSLLFLISAFDATGQEKDTVIRINTNKLKIDTGRIIPYHSPARAALLSATFPGLGQIYNKKYWKVPVIYAAIGISAYYFAKNQMLFTKYQQGYVDYTNTKNFATVQNLEYLKYYSNLTPTQTLEVLDYYSGLFRRWRDWSILCLAGSYFLNIIDATVDGYLFDYDISENLSMRVEPTFMRSFSYTPYNSVGMKMTFNLHK